ASRHGGRLTCDSYRVHCAYGARSHLCVQRARFGFRGTGEDAHVFSGRAQRSGLRKSARSKFRIQGWQGSGCGLSEFERLTRSGGSGNSGGDFAIGCRSTGCWSSEHEGAKSLKAKFAIRQTAIVSLGILFLAANSWAAKLGGTITNGTTGKPSAGDEVILIKLAAGMEEAGHTKTDAQGKFSFSFDDDKGMHLVRAIHQGVTYNQPAPPGS